MSDSKNKNAVSDGEKAEVLKRIISAQDAYISELEPRLYSLQQENTSLRTQLKSAQDDKERLIARFQKLADRNRELESIVASGSTTTSSMSNVAGAGHAGDAGNYSLLSSSNLSSLVERFDVCMQTDSTSASNEEFAAQLSIVSAEKTSMYEELQRVQKSMERKLNDATEDVERWRRLHDEKASETLAMSRMLDDMEKSHSAEIAALESSFTAELSLLREENESLRKLATRSALQNANLHVEQPDAEEYDGISAVREDEYSHRTNSAKRSGPISSESGAPTKDLQREEMEQGQGQGQETPKSSKRSTAQPQNNSQKKPVSASSPSAASDRSSALPRPATPAARSDAGDSVLSANRGAKKSPSGTPGASPAPRSGGANGSYAAKAAISQRGNTKSGAEYSEIDPTLDSLSQPGDALFDSDVLSAETMRVLQDYLSADWQLRIDEAVAHVNQNLLLLGEEREREFSSYAAKFGESRIQPFASQPSSWPVEISESILAENRQLRDRISLLEEELGRMQTEYHRVRKDLEDVHALRNQVRSLQAENDRLSAMYVHHVDTLKVGPLTVTRTEDLENLKRARELTKMLETTFSIKTWFDGPRQKALTDIRASQSDFTQSMQALNQVNQQLKKELEKHIEEKKRYMREVQKLRSAVHSLQEMEKINARKTRAQMSAVANSPNASRANDAALKKTIDDIVAEMEFVRNEQISAQKREYELKLKALNEENQRLRTEVQYKELRTYDEMKELQEQINSLQRRLLSVETVRN
eukprot:ANDGO_05437.mRNA.1 hypothetical protein